MKLVHEYRARRSVVRYVIRYVHRPVALAPKNESQDSTVQYSTAQHSTVQYNTQSVNMSSPHSQATLLPLELYAYTVVVAFCTNAS